MAKMRVSQASDLARVTLESSILEFQEAKVAWERFEVASATVVEQRSKEEREEDIGGHAQDHEGVAEDLTQKIYATDDEEEEKFGTKTKKKYGQR